jgi:hypothetical protein
MPAHASISGDAVLSAELFQRNAPGLDTGSCRGKKRASGADHREDSGWIFGGVRAAGLRMQRKGNRKQKSEAEKR